MIHDGCVGCGYLTVDDITRIYTVARSTVYKLACLHRWGKIRHPDRGRCYRYEDVDAILAQRAAMRMAHKRATSGKVPT